MIEIDEEDNSEISRGILESLLILSTTMMIKKISMKRSLKPWETKSLRINI